MHGRLLEIHILKLADDSSLIELLCKSLYYNRTQKDYTGDGLNRLLAPALNDAHQHHVELYKLRQAVVHIGHNNALQLMYLCSIPLVMIEECGTSYWHACKATARPSKQNRRCIHVVGFGSDYR
jgi:hypothetical protein